jgi:hypothetical protein
MRSVPPRRINEIVNDKCGVTADTALRLAFVDFSVVKNSRSFILSWVVPPGMTASLSEQIATIKMASQHQLSAIRQERALAGR